MAALGLKLRAAMDLSNGQGNGDHLFVPIAAKLRTSGCKDDGHWRRLVNNIGCTGQTKILGGGQEMVKSDKCMGVSQLLGGTCPGWSPKSTPMMIMSKRMNIITCVCCF